MRDWFKYCDWDKAYSNRLRSLRTLLAVSEHGNPPRGMVETGCKLMLQASCRGRYRAVWNLLIDTLHEDWHMRGFARRWEWIRTHVLRRVPNSDMADADRFLAETEALDEMASEL
jgi:hypothetical protein